MSETWDSLRINFDLLVANKDAFVGKDHCLRSLDISASQHAFNEKDIIIIAKLFPYLEHIEINTSNLCNVSKLRIYLPHLRSLTYKDLDIDDYDFDDYDDYRRKRWDFEFRKVTQFLFRRKKNRIIVWIDEDALKEPYWKTSFEDPTVTTNAPLKNEKNKMRKTFKKVVE